MGKADEKRVSLGGATGRLDPRYKRLSKKKTKVVVGDRFAALFTNKDYQEEAPSLPTDKYGIKKPSAAHGKSISKLYEYDPDLSEPEEEETAGLGIRQPPSAKEGNDSANEEEEGEAGSEEDPTAFQWDEESSSTDFEDEEVESFAQDEIEPEEDVPDGEESKRIAIVNLDWDHIRAVDIFHLLRAFLRKDATSIIKKVLILPSLFGLERMRKESEQGPEGIWNKEDSSAEEDEPSIITPLTRKQQLKNERDGFDQDKLRQYQRERLRYYLAVVECDSKETALHLYQSCNDVEIEHTSNKFDMRFIPDDLTFDPSQEPTDVATSAPADHALPEFHTKALQHTRVKLTWDQDDPERIKLTRKLRDDSLYSDNLFLPLSEERKLKEYLADSDSDSSNESEGEGSALKSKTRKKQVRKKYASLLKEIHGSDTQSTFGQSSSSGAGNMDMEITFTPGLTGSVQDLVDRTLAKEGAQSSWDSHLEKLAEKKRLKKQERKARLLKEQQEEIEEREKRKRERRKGKKKAKKEGGEDGEASDQSADEEGGNELDPRFANVLTNPKDFGFDRTNPQYKSAASFVDKVHKNRAAIGPTKGTKDREASGSHSETSVKSMVANIRSRAPPSKRQRTQ